MTVYQVGDVAPPTPAPTPETAGDYKLLGCAEDAQAESVSDRTRTRLADRIEKSAAEGIPMSIESGMVQRCIPALSSQSIPYEAGHGIATPRRTVMSIFCQYGVT